MIHLGALKRDELVTLKPWKVFMLHRCTMIQQDWNTYFYTIVMGIVSHLIHKDICNYERDIL